MKTAFWNVLTGVVIIVLLPLVAISILVEIARATADGEEV